MALYLGDLELATGGGATGTGLPVNSYKSFKVGATSSPSGYNATTGLYTHPNGDYWLRTGNTLSGVAATYPDAILGRPESPASSMASTGNTVSGGTAAPKFDGNGTYWTASGASSPFIFTERTYYTGTATGNTITGSSLLGTSGSMRGAYDPFNNEYYMTTNNTGYVERFNGITFTSIGTFFGPFNNKNAMVVASANTIYFSGTSGTLLQCTNNTGAVQTGLTIGVNLVNADGNMSYSRTSGFFYIKNGATTLAQLSSTGVLLSTLTGTGGYTSDGIFASGTNSTVFVNNTEYGNTASIIGDPTTRTDANSGQPLFIKIK